MKQTDIEKVRAARDHVAQLRRHLSRGDIDDDTVFDAVCLRLSAAIESVSTIAEEPRLVAFGDAWPAIWSVRNRIAHGYVHLNRTIIVATVEHDLGEFERGLDVVEALLPESERSDT